MTNQEPTTQKDQLSVNKQESSATLVSKDSKNKTEQEASTPSALSTIMSEDKEDSGIQISNEEFIKAVFQNTPEGASPAVCSKPGDPQEGGWKAKPSYCAIKDLFSGQNNYLNCSSFYLDETGTFNVRKENFAAFHFLLLDDLDEKTLSKLQAKLTPSYVMETSPGNYQVGIFLDKPITDSAEAKRIHDAIIKANFCDPGASGVCRWSRLPNGINGKPKYRDKSGNPFRCRLKHWNPEKRYTLQEIIDGLELKLAENPNPKTQSTAVETKVNAGLPAEDTHSVQANLSESDNKELTKLKKLLACINPDIGYHEWLIVLIVISNVTKGSAEGLELANTWSSKGKKYKGLHEIESKWKSFNLNSAKPVTISTLCKMIKDQGGDLKKILGAEDSFFRRYDSEFEHVETDSNIPTYTEDQTSKSDSVTVDHSPADTPNVTAAPSIDQEKVIAELAAMKPMDYDRVRAERAKELGVQLKTLDALVKDARNAESKADQSPFSDIQPWSEPVDPEPLLEEISAIFLRFIVLIESQAYTLALWVVHSFLINVFHVSPIALINAPEKACGKTQLLKIIGYLCRRPLPVVNVTPSALFRSVELWQPTLLIDEADTFLSDNKELHNLINAGYEYGGSVLRSETINDSHIPRKFSVYCAKAIAGIALERHLPDATMSRGIIFSMRRKHANEKVERFRNADSAMFNVIKSKMARFAADYAQQLRLARPEMPDKLSDRDQDKWEPLFAIAECAGDKWRKRVTEAALKLSNTGDAPLCKGAELLSDIQYIFDGGENPRKISTADLIKALCKDDEAPWGSYNYGKQITPRQLANLLNPYGIKSKTVRLDHGYTPKGYDAEQFQDAFERYIPSKKPSSES